DEILPREREGGRALGGESLRERLPAGRARCVIEHPALRKLAGVSARGTRHRVIRLEWPRVVAVAHPVHDADDVPLDGRNLRWRYRFRLRPWHGHLACAPDRQLAGEKQE